MKLLFVALTSCVLAQIAALHAAETVYRVNPNSPALSDGSLTMKDGPGQQHQTVNAIPADTEGVRQIGPCVDADDGTSYSKWCNVQWKGVSGWVLSGGLELSLRSDQAESSRRPNQYNQCRARCDSHYETAFQEITSPFGSLGGPERVGDATIEAARDGLMLCYRECDRP
jgi:uncharacterized protein YraI